MALRLLVSPRLQTVQRTSLLRLCRHYSPLQSDPRLFLLPNLNSPTSNLYASPLTSKSSFPSTDRRYFLSYQQVGRFSSSASRSSDSDPPSSSSPSDGSSSSSSSNDGKNDDGNQHSDGNDGSNENRVPIVIQPGNPLMSMEVPDNYPIVPLIPVTRHPLFPKFIKMLEITNKDLMELIRRKVKLNQPYAGIFLRKETPTTSATNEKSSKSEAEKEKEKMLGSVSNDVIKSLDDVYQIGAFVQIHEVHDMGDRLRMIVMAHRRIKIVGIASDDFGYEEIDRRRPTPQKTNGNRRRSRRKDELSTFDETIGNETTTPPPPPPVEDPIVVNKILMVNTENVKHNEYEQTSELKVKLSSTDFSPTFSSSGVNCRTGENHSGHRCVEPVLSVRCSRRRNFDKIFSFSANRSPL